MNKYSKVVVALVVMVIVAGVGFGTAFGYGSHHSVKKPVITLAPAGKVLGESTMSLSAFVDKLVSENIISAERASFIKLLISLGILK